MMEKEKTIYKEMTNAEKEVAEYLRSINLYWIFEYPIFVQDERDRPRVWTPDFYLPELGIYIEVCGKDRECYSYREKVLKKNRVQIIFIHQFKDGDSWKKFLVCEISRIQGFREEKIIDSRLRGEH
ncbi:hypothetical protein KAR91_07295 [Candidatus Pacearchaeota archaeon]|nr:hypothetical protein [Candidatus Pacearchaeota archaeon]